MWLGIWAARRHGEPKWLEFCDRYRAFRPEDTTDLCAAHHSEIHEIYDEIIRADRAITNRALHYYSWAQAEALMDKLEQTFFIWLEKETPGIDPWEFRRNR